LIYTGTWFIQGLIYTGTWFIQGLVYTGTWFIQGLIYTGTWFIQSLILTGFTVFIPSPTKLRRDIVTLPSVLPQHPCEHSRINILQWILTKLGTYLVLQRIWNLIDFQGQRSRSPGQIIYHITSL
jgi:hypothetical protein